MKPLPEALRYGLPACTIYDSDTPRQVVAKIDYSVYAVDGREHPREFLPDYYARCKRIVTETESGKVQRHKFF